MWRRIRARRLLAAHPRGRSGVSGELALALGKGDRGAELVRGTNGRDVPSVDALRRAVDTRFGLGASTVLRSAPRFRNRRHAGRGARQGDHQDHRGERAVQHDDGSGCSSLG
jgi:hypothetical protein